MVERAEFEVFVMTEVAPPKDHKAEGGAQHCKFELYRVTSKKLPWRHIAINIE